MLPLFLIRRRLLADRRLLGQWGERFCEARLLRKGWRTFAKAYKTADGEIDLVMVEPDGGIVFIEVKTRAGEDFAPAETAIDYKKKLRMTCTAKQMIKKYNLFDRPLRFDVAVIIIRTTGKPEFRYYQNAFKPIFSPIP